MAKSNPLPYVTEVHDKASTFTPHVIGKLRDGQWHSAADISADVQGLDDRTIRAIAERSHGVILSSQLGYKLTEHATLTEVRRSASTLRSQGRKMIMRADEQMYVKSCNRG